MGRAGGNSWQDVPSPIHCYLPFILSPPPSCTLSFSLGQAQGALSDPSEDAQIAASNLGLE